MEKYYKFEDIKNSLEVETLTLYVYGDIRREKWYDSDVIASEFAKELSEFKNVKEIIVRINSNGGEVHSSIAIMNLLKDHQANVTIIIDGMCASGASLIAMAGDTIKMNKGAFIMIHEAWTYTDGNADDLIKHAEVLKGINEEMIKIYNEKTGISHDELVEMLKAETFLNDEDALKKGFCDEIINDNEVAVALNKDFLIINGIEFNKKDYKKSLEKISITNKNNNKSMNKNTNKKCKEVEKMTVEMIKDKYPEIFNKIKEMGVESERGRIKNIEDNTIKGFEDVAVKAKYEEPLNENDYLKAVVKAQKNIGDTYTKNTLDETEQIKIETSINNEQVEDKTTTIVNQAKNIVKNMNLRRK